MRAEFPLLANGIASHDTFSRVFALIDAEGFEACFITWMERLCPSMRGHAIHVNGKSLRGSRNDSEAMAHLVSACDSAVGVTLWQISTADKSNEIIAISRLLRLLNIRGISITVEAMGCRQSPGMLPVTASLSGASRHRSRASAAAARPA